MSKKTPELRNTVKAVCFNTNNEVLLLRKQYKKNDELYTLPGGSQEPEETLHETLRRECKEEIDCTINIAELRYVCEHCRVSKSGKAPRHKVEFGFNCTVPKSYTPKMGKKPDSNQAEVLWVPLKKLESLPLSPEGLKTLLCNDTLQQGYNGYMGKGLK